MLNKIKKIFINGYNLLWQDKVVSLVNLGTTILVSFFIWSGFLGFYFFNQTISFLQERLDFSIYFKNNVLREDILKLRKTLQVFPGVSEVNLITQEAALEKFKEESKINPIIAKALTEIGANPLTDYLVVKASNSEAYIKIADYLKKSRYKDYIDYVNYFENQKVIKKVISLSNQFRLLLSFIIIIILAFTGLIVFNTVFISIYTKKEEIEVLKLVGASKWFIKGPFFVSILIFSFLGYLISLGILVLALIKTENIWPNLLPNFQPSIFIMDNFFMLNGLALGIILLINYLSAFIALEKYLRI